MIRFVDNETPLNAEILNQNLGTALGVNGGSIELKNLNGAAISSVTLPAATNEVRGGIKISTSGTVLNIMTT